MTTAESDLQSHKQTSRYGNQVALNAGHNNQLSGVMDMLKRDRFELLSAYLDGEVTAAERQQVEDWLVNDPEIQRLYARLIRLRQELRLLPVPPAQQPVEQTIQQVYRRLNRRYYRTVAWGGTAIAALFIGALSGTLPSRQMLQMATSPNAGNAPIEPLMVALNNPVIEIPKAAVAPVPPNQQLKPQPQHRINLN